VVLQCTLTSFFEWFHSLSAFHNLSGLLAKVHCRSWWGLACLGKQTLGDGVAGMKLLVGDPVLFGSVLVL